MEKGKRVIIEREEGVFSIIEEGSKLIIEKDLRYRMEFDAATGEFLSVEDALRGRSFCVSRCD